MGSNVEDTYGGDEMFWQEWKLRQVYRDNEAAETSEELSKTLRLTILEFKKAPYGRFGRLELTLKQNPAVQLCADHPPPSQWGNY